jgi:type I restriction enzyme R subunit
VCRITGLDGDAGRERLDEFRRVESDVPTIAVTARLLTTGVDIPTLRNIVLFRVIKSMPEFKQIIGRGTRLFPEDGKFSFDIIDFVEATRLFNDPLFDGPPMRLIRDETDAEGNITDTVNEETPDAEDETVAEPTGSYTEEQGGTLPPSSITDQDEIDEILANPRIFYVNGVQVIPWGTAFYVYDPDAGGLTLKEFSQFVRDRVLELNLDPQELLAQWSQSQTRQALRERLDEIRITEEDLAEWAGRPDADTIDLLLYVAWELPLLSRAERARRVAMRHRDFLTSFAPEAQEVLNKVLEQYAARGAEELDVGALRSEAYANLGTVVELAGRFGGSASLRAAMGELGGLIYAAS